MDRYPIKLVRDRIEEAIPDLDGAEIRVSPVGSTTRRRMLRAKLLEEVTEYLVEGGEEELADVLEVVEALAVLEEGSTFAEIRKLQLAKRRERGGFLQGHVMFAVDGERSA